MKQCWTLSFRVANEFIHFVEKEECFTFEREFDRAKVFFQEIEAVSYLAELRRLNPSIVLFKRLVVLQHVIEMRH